jgi:hypothetical protein
MTIAQDISKSVAAAINKTPITTFPFDHVVLNDIFSTATYQAIVAMLPVDDYYRELKHGDAMMASGQSARLQFPLNKANIKRLPPEQRDFWNQVLSGLSSNEIEGAWRNKFKCAMETITGKSLSSIKLRSHYTLFRDIGGYKISIHPDSPRKAITTQYYLPTDESQTHLGTLFHEKNSDGSYNEAYAMSFAPNSGYGFAVTPASYHSVKPMGQEDRPRNSLMVIFNYDRGLLIEGFKAVRTKLRGWYDNVFGLTSTYE